MNDVQIEQAWHSLVGRLRLHGRDARLIEELDDLQGRLQHEIFGELPTFPEPRPDVSPSDIRLAFVLDALEALALLEPADPSYPRERASLLFKVGRHLEAAADSLEAARRFEREAADGTGLTGDEEDWARTEFWHAAKNFALAGHPASATALLPRLDEGDREEIAALVAAAADAA